MASVQRVVVVAVAKTGAGISRAGFGTVMGVFQIPAVVQPNRFALYSEVQDLIDAGSAADDPWVKWATVQKGQAVSPARFAIGRRDPGTAQVDDVTITAADAGTWTLTIDTIVYSFISGASDTTQTIAEGLADAVNAGDASVVLSVPAAGAFTVTAFIAGEAFVNGGIVTGGAGTGTFVNSTPNAVAEVMATALAAINTANTADWYFLNIETRNDADITAAQAFVAPLRKRFFGQSSDPDARDGVASNIFDTIQALNDPRTSLFWHDDDTEFLDSGEAAIAAAADLDAAGGVITMFGKQVQSVPVDVLTEDQITNIAGDNESNDGFGGNVHVEIASRGFTMPGKSTDGEFIDVGTTLDWTFFRVSEDLFLLPATTPTKVPYTTAGLTAQQNAVQGRLDIGVVNGHFSPDTLPSTSVPEIVDVATADKNTRVSRNVLGFALLEGAIHKTFVRIEASA